MGSSLSASLRRGAVTLLKPITPGSPHRGCKAALGHKSRLHSCRLPLGSSRSMCDNRTEAVDELNMEKSVSPEELSRHSIL